MAPAIVPKESHTKEYSLSVRALYDLIEIKMEIEIECQKRSRNSDSDRCENCDSDKGRREIIINDDIKANIN